MRRVFTKVPLLLPILTRTSCTFFSYSNTAASPPGSSEQFGLHEDNRSVVLSAGNIYIFFNHRLKFLAAASAHGAAGASEDNFEIATGLRLSLHPAGSGDLSPSAPARRSSPRGNAAIPGPAAAAEETGDRSRYVRPDPATELSLPCPSCTSTQLLSSQAPSEAILGPGIVSSMGQRCR